MLADSVPKLRTFQWVPGMYTSQIGLKGVIALTNVRMLRNFEGGRVGNSWIPSTVFCRPSVLARPPIRPRSNTTFSGQL